jgi:hypothetical protein
MRSYCGGQDIFSVGTLKGVGRVDEQNFIDTYTKVAFAKLYDRKTLITAADLLNDRVVPFFDEHDTRLSRVLTDRGTEDLLAERHPIEIEHGRWKRSQMPLVCGLLVLVHAWSISSTAM